jgi:hypothetical protein
LKNLVEDLKHTGRRTNRYANLKTAIVALFNSLNDLLTEAGRILRDSNYKIVTTAYNLSTITRKDVGLPPR